MHGEKVCGKIRDRGNERFWHVRSFFRGKASVLIIEFK